MDFVQVEQFHEHQHQKRNKNENWNKPTNPKITSIPCLKSQSHKTQSLKSKCLPFLTSSVPNLGLDGFVVDQKRLSLKLNPNGCFRLQTELVPSKTSQELRLTHRWVSDQHHLEYVVDLLIETTLQIRHGFLKLKSYNNRSEHRSINVRRWSDV